MGTLSFHILLLHGLKSKVTNSNNDRRSEHYEVWHIVTPEEVGNSS